MGENTLDRLRRDARSLAVSVSMLVLAFSASRCCILASLAALSALSSSSTLETRGIIPGSCLGDS